jgi:hypothetical protein
MLKRDINLLLLLFATILIALGALGVVGKADFAIGKQAGLQRAPHRASKSTVPLRRPNSAGFIRTSSRLSPSVAGRPWRCIPTATWPMPDQESSQVRSACRARSYEGVEHPANPTAARRSWPRWSVMIRG